MIDLSYKPKKEEQKEPPMIVQMILLAPFALLLTAILLRGMIGIW